MAPRPGMALRRAVRAFTLIEVLVVVVIVGIISAIALLSVGLLGDDRAVRQEARRMATLIELAADEAVLQGRDLGLEVMQTGYRFVEFDPFLNQWQEIAGDEFLRPRQLPEGVEFTLFIEDRRVLLNPEPARTGSDEPGDERGQQRYARRGNTEGNYAPHALIMSSGQLTPFELALRRTRDRTEIFLRVEPTGEIEVGSAAADDA
ncbi:MAG: type II secretion system minor pseudopilin GspH [Woeseiaceae bacterium]|nr:type II secretion system minor pseudopilin GspH [Woeseiaceae bacterium]